MTKTVKVAVVGSGLAGLTASYLLDQETQEITGQDDKHIEVHLFEKATEIGMDSSSISLPLPGSKDGSWRIDVPMRSFQGGYYRNLIAMYQRLGVVFETTNFTYSFSFLSHTPSSSKDEKPRPRVTATALYNGQNGTQGVSKPSVLDGSLSRGAKTEEDWLHPQWLQSLWGTALFVLLAIHLLICYLITLWHALPYARSTELEKMTLGEWAEKVAPSRWVGRMLGLDVAWDDYVHTILVPLMSAMCTAPEEDIFNHPVEEILDYVWLGLGQNHYVLKNGVQEVATRLSSDLEHVHLGSSIVSMHPDASDSRRVTIECLNADGTNSTYTGFDHVILATQASRAIPILGCYAASLGEDMKTHKKTVEAQMRCLKTFKYCSTIVINHTDDSLLPSEVSDRRDLNLISSNWEGDEATAEERDGLCVPSTYTMATHILPRPEGYPVVLPTVYQTTNAFIPPQKDTILSVSSLERAVLTLESKEAIRGLCKPGDKDWGECPTEVRCKLGELQGAGRVEGGNVPGIWICGSYAYLGVPLLEGCVVSARNVVEQGILKSEGLMLREVPWEV